MLNSDLYWHLFTADTVSNIHINFTNSVIALSVSFQFDQFVFDLYEVFEMDALVTSHPIYVPVNNPDEINEIFDAISYSKVSI